MSRPLRDNGLRAALLRECSAAHWSRVLITPPIWLILSASGQHASRAPAMLRADAILLK